MIITECNNNENYGSYNYEAIGIFSPKRLFEHFPPGEEGVQMVCDWMEKYHPRTFFGGFSYISLGDNKDNFSDVVFLIATERANLDWKNKNLEKAKKFKWKKLPIAVSDKKIEKWQKSLPTELILPEYFLKSSTIEELKENWKKAQ